MDTRTFNPKTYAPVEHAHRGREPIVEPILRKAVEKGKAFAVPTYTSKKNYVSGSGQVQSGRLQTLMRSIAPEWRYFYNAGEKSLEIVFVPPDWGTEIPSRGLIKTAEEPSTEPEA